MFYCFFEQSGTFKNEFKKLGYDAEDYDILNQFNQTDHVVDLFEQIELAYEGGDSIFDKITPQDTIIAFFPCVRFSVQFLWHYKGTTKFIKDKSLLEKLEYDIKIHDELNHLYKLVSKLTIVCLKRKIPLIIENPYSSRHYLTQYWAAEPSIIDYDRSERGDFFEKPTQYFFFNCEPRNNFVLEGVQIKELKTVWATNKGPERSMISKDYANRFIREFILEEKIDESIH